MTALERVLEEKLHSAQNGDADAREQVLNAGKPFVLRVVSTFCQRKLEWGRDDELSIGLIAMNEAINRYSHHKQIPFLAFARIVIKSRLKDFFRRESKHNAISLENKTVEGSEYLYSGAENTQAWDKHIKELVDRERKEEILEFGKLLKQFDLSYEELVNVSPKHRDSRENLIRTAWQLANNQDLMSYLLDKKRLPIAELSLLTGVKRKTLERGRRYIVALALLFYHRENFIYMYSYLKLTNWGKGGA
ncbi:RNA polymerase sigma factor [Desulfohalotomaculum tongense]|uniref:RNA polymerase sigma-I factor n=1 Tax=Desulforadius tongensis TaxID=1216062 RepID=UPI001EE5FF45|nr:RNA polymerase sigma-I factor [Desulforadius tongensis]MBM7855276.1 RNA polymerase sigma factor [Desulforadius tongensis]